MGRRKSVRVTTFLIAVGIDAVVLGMAFLVRWCWDNRRRRKLVIV